MDKYDLMFQDLDEYFSAPPEYTDEEIDDLLDDIDPMDLEDITNSEEE